MSTAQPTVNQEKRLSGSVTSIGLIARLILLFLIDGFSIWFIFNLIENDSPVLAIAIGLLTLFSNIVVLRSDAVPIRWMVVGLVLMALFAIYPILFTSFVSLTNFGFGHLLSKQQTIDQLENVKYLPEGAGSYSWTAYRSDDGNFAIWFQREDGTALLAFPNRGFIVGTPGEEGVGDLDDDGFPLAIEGYERMNRLTVVRYINKLGETVFGEGEDTIIRIQNLDAAAELEQKYVYNAESDTMTDQENGTIYSPVEGFFVSLQGDRLTPGFQIYIGLENFTTFFKSPALRGPLFRILVWNFAFAFISVTTTFFLGLAVALLFNDPDLPGRKLIITLLLIPYTIPSLISIMVWRGMLNPELGVVNRIMNDLFGWAPPWFTDQWWAKAAILMINLWLGYPYFMLICSGALQAIPKDIYSAAEVDGANIWQQFWRITFPLLLVAVGPLLVASFVFNFNNFNVIWLFIQGGPPIAGAATNAGHTDILISYVYNLAFAGGRGAQYGFASAITIIIFVFVAVFTLFQFRYTKMWEEVGENV